MIMILSLQQLLFDLNKYSLKNPTVYILALVCDLVFIWDLKCLVVFVTANFINLKLKSMVESQYKGELEFFWNGINIVATKNLT